MNIYKNDKGAVALIMVMIITFTLLILLLYVNFNPTVGDKETISLKKAYIGADLGIDEGNYFFKNNVEKFYGVLNGCKRVSGGVPIQYSSDSNAGSDNYGELNFGFNYDTSLLNETTYLNGRGFLNRSCSIYSKSYPYDGNEDFIIDSRDITLPLLKPKNEMFFIKQVDRDQNKGFVFSKDTLLDENGFVNTETEPKFLVYFNTLTTSQIDDFGGFDYLQGTNKYKSIVNLLKSKDIEVSKSNIMLYFNKDLSNISDDAKIEIGLVEYDGNFSSPDKGYNINTSSKPKVIKRDICEPLGPPPHKCELKLNGADTLKDNKVYFFYYKTYDKATTISMQILDSSNNAINFITGDFVINSYGNDEKLLINKKYVKENALNSDIVSAIFNYLYYSQN